MPEHRYAEEIAERARAVLPEPVFRFFSQGARDGLTAAEAEAVWDAYRLVPRVLHDVSSVSTAVTLLGHEYAAPFGIGPTTLQRAAHPDGEVAMARAAATVGVPFVLSSNAGSTFEDVAAAVSTWWLQIYVTEERSACRPVLDRAVAAGARAVVLTADTPTVGTKYDGDEPTVWDLAQPGWLRTNFSEGHDDQPGAAKARDLGPQDIDWLADVTGLPVVVKGVLSPADAKRCVDAGAAAVWVSNHGGRQLDGAAATADVLGAVAGAVQGRAQVYADGGVRNARHAVVARAMGADAVFLGRPPLYALADAGAEGVCRLLEELASDLVETLRLCGYSGWSSVRPDLLLGP